MQIDPLDCPRTGCRAFEVQLYNQVVRALVKENREHRDFDDRWADLNRQMVQAHDADEARRIASRRYPPEEGFVIEVVVAR